MTDIFLSEIHTARYTCVKISHNLPHYYIYYYDHKQKNYNYRAVIIGQIVTVNDCDLASATILCTVQELLLFICRHPARTTRVAGSGLYPATCTTA